MMRRGIGLVWLVVLVVGWTACSDSGKSKADGSGDMVTSGDGTADQSGSEAGGDGTTGDGAADGASVDRSGTGDGSSDGSSDSAGPDVADLGPPDAPPTCTTFSGTVGKPCSSSSPCPSGYTCLTLGSSGFCSTPRFVLA